MMARNEWMLQYRTCYVIPEIFSEGFSMQYDDVRIVFTAVHQNLLHIHLITE